MPQGATPIRKQRARSLSPGVRRIGGGFAYCAPPGPGSTGDTAPRHGSRSAPRLRFVTADHCRSMLLTQMQDMSPSQLSFSGLHSSQLLLTIKPSHRILVQAS